MSYVGVLQIMIEFKSKDACKNSWVVMSWIIDYWKNVHGTINLSRQNVLTGLILKVCLYVFLEQGFFKKIIPKQGVIAQLEDSLKEDVYKNRICVLTTLQNIIYDVVSVRVDGILFKVRFNEAPGWTPFICDLHQENLDGSELKDNQDNGEGNYSLSGHEDISSDLSGIYDTMEKMKA